MKKIIFLIGLFFSFQLLAQEAGSPDMSLSASGYLFSYNSKLQNCSFASGITMSLNTDKKIVLQYGFLYDFKKYIFYEKGFDSVNGSMTYIPVTRYNLFFPLLIHYRYLLKENFSMFATAGFIIGGKYSIDEYGDATEGGSYNAFVGSGISAKLFKSIMISAYPEIRFKEGTIMPGFSLDVSYMFRSGK